MLLYMYVCRERERERERDRHLAVWEYIPFKTHIRLQISIDGCLVLFQPIMTRYIVIG